MEPFIIYYMELWNQNENNMPYKDKNKQKEYKRI